MFRPTLAYRPIPGGISVRATRNQMFGGGVSYRDIPGLTIEQLNAWITGDELIQNALAHITVEDRDFLMNGLNPGESL